MDLFMCWTGTNGKFLSATPFVEKLTWAKGIDAKAGRYGPGSSPLQEGTRICPGFAGSTNWYAPSYNESTHLVYFLALEDARYFLGSRKNLRKARLSTPPE